MAINLKHKENKKKVGTILDKEIVKKIKERSVAEGKTISEIIQDAILRYNEADVTNTELRIAAVERFCSEPFKIKTNELNKFLKEDYYAL